MAVPMECKNDDTLKKFKLEYEDLTSPYTRGLRKARKKHQSKTTTSKR